MSKPWKIYEEQILEKFRREFPSAVLYPDKKIEGVDSKALRQVDILISGSMVGHKMTGVIECKYFNKKVDVKSIDSFIGFLEDIKADLGIIITNIGFTKAALNRAAAKKIRIEIVEFKKLDSYHFDWDICEACAISSDYFHEMEWNSVRTAACNKKNIVVQEGNCSYCATLSLKCSECGHIMCIWENYGVENECFCGKKFIVESEYIGEGMNEDVIYLKCKHRTIEMRKNVIKKPIL